MTLTLDLVTPEKLVSSQEVGMVVVPGQDGDFGVLVGHSPLISALRMGVINIYDNDNHSKESMRVFVTGGFAEVTNERCTILADEAIDLAGITRTDAENRLKVAKESLEDAETDREKSFAEAELKIAEVLLGLV